MGARPSRCWLCNRWRVRVAAKVGQALRAEYPDEAAELRKQIGQTVYDELMEIWREEQAAMSA